MMFRWLILLTPVVAGGCVLSGPRADSVRLEPTVSDSLSFANSGDYAQPTLGFRSAEEGVSLAELIELAARHPEVGIVRAKTEAARGALIQAGLYPNPFFGWDADNMGNNQGRAGQQGPSIVQEIVVADKLRLAQNAAAHGVAAAEWQARTRWFEVLTRVRLAFFEALTAQEEMDATREIVGISQKALDAAKALQKAGAGTQPDVLQAEVEVEQSQLRLRVAEQRHEAALRLLAAAAGVPRLPATKLVGSLTTPAPAYEWEEALKAVKSRSSEVQQALATILQAEQALLKSRADRVPNPIFEARPFYSFPDHDTMLRLSGGMAVPIFNRNQGNIHKAAADLAAAHQTLRQTELALAERLATAFRRYQAAAAQKVALEGKIVPSAQEALDLIELGYKRGDPKYNYAALLQAQRTLQQARLSVVQAHGELWKAASEIAGLLQLDPR